MDFGFRRHSHTNKICQIYLDGVTVIVTVTVLFELF